MAPLRDLTGGRSAIPVEVVASPIFETLTIGWTVYSKNHAGAHDVGEDFYDTVMGRVPLKYRSGIELIGASGGSVWLALFDTAAELSTDAGVDDLVDAFRAKGARHLRKQILNYSPCFPDGALASAASGDAEAVRALVESATAEQPEAATKLAAVGDLLALSHDDLLDTVEEAWRALASATEPEVAAVTAGLARDAASARALTLTMPPERVIENVTNGIEFELRPGITSIRLIPSAVVRPWSLMLEDDGTQVFVYPVADEHLDVDTDLPPTWLVAMYKALGDERRLRILRRVASGPTTFGELVEMLGMARSTVHHHIGILRAAGLIRVTIPAGKESATYSLRTEVLPEAERLLAGYLVGIGDEPRQPHRPVKEGEQHGS